MCVGNEFLEQKGRWRRSEWYLWGDDAWVPLFSISETVRMSEVTATTGTWQRKSKVSSKGPRHACTGLTANSLYSSYFGSHWLQTLIHSHFRPPWPLDIFRTVKLDTFFTHYHTGSNLLSLLLLPTGSSELLTLGTPAVHSPRRTPRETTEI